MIWYCLLILAVIQCNVSVSIKDDICSAEDIADTNIEYQSYSFSEPMGSTTKDVAIIKKLKVHSNNECVKNCCAHKKCEAVLISRNLCILYKCFSTNACLPKKLSKFGPKNMYIVLKSLSNNTDQSLQRDVFDDKSQSCELSVPDNCPVNEMCKRIQEDRRSGVCVCVSGFVKQPSGCVEVRQENRVIEEVPKATLSPDMERKSESTTSSQRPRTSTSTSTIKPTTKVQMNNIAAQAGPDIHVHVTNPQQSTQPNIVSIYGSAIGRDGSVLTDGISYQWKRGAASLSVGTILNDSDHKPTLMLMNLLLGQYTFVLTVTDKDGDTSSDAVSVFVTEIPDNRFGDLVDILFETNVYKFTEQESINFSRRMGHVIEKNLLYVDCKIHVVTVSAERENRTLITFYAEAVDPNTKNNQILSAGMLEEKLKQRLTQHKFIFDYPISKFQSRVCYNSCGGHGKCCSYSHRCMCTLPWMNNPWHESSTGFSNCDMHVMIILLICVASVFVSILMFVSLRTIARICRRRRRYGKDVLRYKLLDNTDS